MAGARIAPRLIRALAVGGMIFDREPGRILIRSSCEGVTFELDVKLAGEDRCAVVLKKRHAQAAVDAVRCELAVEVNVADDRVVLVGDTITVQVKGRRCEPPEPLPEGKLYTATVPSDVAVYCRRNPEAVVTIRGHGHTIYYEPIAEVGSKEPCSSLYARVPCKLLALALDAFNDMQVEPNLLGVADGFLLLRHKSDNVTATAWIAPTIP